MDFPNFFRTSINNLTIASGRFRGIAALCKASPIFVGRSGQEDQVQAITGVVFTDRDVALNVIVKSCLFKGTNTMTDGTTIIEAKPGVRYIIHSVSLTALEVVTDTFTILAVSFQQNGSTQNISLAANTLTAQSLTMVFPDVDVICDTNTAITVHLVGTLAAGRINVSYQVVGAS